MSSDVSCSKVMIYYAEVCDIISEGGVRQFSIDNTLVQYSNKLWNAALVPLSGNPSWCVVTRREYLVCSFPQDIAICLIQYPLH